METPGATSRKRVRLAPEVRRAQFIVTASQVLLDQGHLPISLDRVCEAAGASKALIYAYFPGRHDLANAILSERFAALAESGLERAAAMRPLPPAVRACAAIYFEEVAASGPLIHLILRDPSIGGHVSLANRQFRDRIASSLARQARGELDLAPKAAIAAFNLIVAIPELAGRMVWSGEMDRERARALMDRLVVASLEALIRGWDAAPP
jgi:AcrR family transcriptional regulator